MEHIAKRRTVVICDGLWWHPIACPEQRLHGFEGQCLHRVEVCLASHHTIATHDAAHLCHLAVRESIDTGCFDLLEGGLTDWLWQVAC
jgi:hypothetical protein